uniref:t-SNARE coiled-coil homology domain-containing protein n=1 Tax=Aureoumbra lagunensis TaxID=44058 RepID=A0A7S3K4E5_9STRA
MDTDLDYWHEEYRKAVDNVCGSVDQVNLIVEENVEKGQKDKLMSDTDELMRTAKNIRKSYILEIRQIKDKRIKDLNQEKFDKVEERYQLAARQLEDIRNANERSELLANGEGTGDEFKDNDAYLSAAENLQDQTASSLARTRQLVEDSKEVGTATVDVLAKQSEQLQSITSDVRQMDSNLQRSDALIKDFTSRMLGDTIIRVFSCLNFSLVLIILVYVAMTGKSIGDVTSAEKKDANPGEGDD